MDYTQLNLVSIKVTEDEYNFLLQCRNNSELDALETLRKFHASRPDILKKISPFTFEIFAQNANLEAMKFMVEQGYINPGDNNTSAIIYSCEKGNLEIAHFLLENGADPNFSNYLPMFFACSNGHIDIVNELVSYGADANALQDTPCVIALRHGHKDIFKLLYETYGANPHTQNNVILKEACLRNNVSVIYLFLELGIDILYDGIFLLAVAAALGFTEMMQIFVNNGVNPKQNNLIAFASSIEADKLTSLSFLCNALPENDKLTETELRDLLKHTENIGLPFNSECCKFLRKVLNVTFESQFSLDIDVTDECPVCLEKATLILGCRHCVCGDCLQKLLDNFCPVCRLYIDKQYIKRRK